MAGRPIVRYPDPILKTICKPIKEIDDGILRLAREMEEALDASPGVALAAPQIGRSVRMIVVDAGRNKNAAGSRHGRLVLINPVCAARENERVIREGCLSVPDYTGNVRRARRVQVEGLTLDGAPLALWAEGFEALALQHEIDHLDGVLFIDRIASLSTDLFRRKRR
jgi:peptide deformylase